MIRLALLAMVSLQFLAPWAWSGPAGYERLKTQAEREYSNKSFRKAHEHYLRADAMELPPADARWVDFRLADTLWRAQAGSDTADSSKYDKAQKDLQALVRDVKRVENRDRVWAEVQESLGDFHWTRRDRKNWWQAWQHYQQALDWWAGAAQLDLARERYLRIAFTAVDPPWRSSSYYYGYHGNYLPAQVIENVLKIVRDENRRAQAHFLMAMTIRSQGGGYLQQARIPEEFEAALKIGKTTDWYDDALYHYAQHMENQGRLVEQPDGGWRSEMDYAKALELYRRLMREFKKGQTRYWDDARSRIRYITEESMGVSVSNIFLPDSEVQFHLNWRNIKKINLALYSVDLTSSVELKGGDSSSSWLAKIDLGRQKRIRTWSKDTKDQGKHLPGSSSEHFQGKLSPGAYVIEARAGKLKSRDLVLVTDVAVVLKAVGRQALVFVCDVHDGSPLSDARVSVWFRSYHKSSYRWQNKTAATGEDGLARFSFDKTTSSGSSIDLFVAARRASRQAFTTGSASQPGRSDTWKVYAFTDRPAYRPEDTVQFKFIARSYDGQQYATPAGQVLEWRIDDSRGSKVTEGKEKLNAFGSVWGSLELSESMPLGEYRVSFWTKGHGRHVGSATLFRLEEYKLPEFIVTVKTPEEAGKPKIFRVGDKVEAQIQVDYYFGGAVAKADVEVLVFQSPYYQYWYRPRDYPWFYSDMTSHRRHYWGGRGSQIKRERLKTDSTGKAVVTFDTPRGANQDFEYRIEARVTDSSRREVIGTGKVRVTRQSFFVHAQPRHFLHRPKDRVFVDFKALDANEQPARASGTVTVFRERFSLVRQGYERNKVLSRKVKTDAKGLAEFHFTAPGDGYYSITWKTEERRGRTITTSTSVWVASDASTDLGYHHGSLQIIVDRDTVRAGQTAPVMLFSPTSDRWILFSVEGEDLYHSQVVHLTGTVKLVRLKIEQKHVPNIYLQALMVADRQVHTVQQQVVVPPERHFLDVTVKADKPEYKPRENARLTVTARDHRGKPVRAEVALGMIDESVYYIQSDYAGDPRQYFYGTKRGQRVQTRTTFQHRSYIRLVRAPTGALVDERYLEQHLAAARKDRPTDSRDLAGMEDEEEMQAEALADMPAGPARRARDLASGKKTKMSKSAAPAQPIAMPDSAPPPEPGESAAAEPAVTVRSDFRATAVWRPGVVTDARGEAVVSAKMPDTLTGWKALARAATKGNQFGIGSATARTRMPLIVRLQAPRFFVVGDETTISAVVNNNTKKALRARVGLTADGVRVLGGSKTKQGWRGAGRTVRVPAGGEGRVDWRVRVERAGQVLLRTVARGGGHADAMEKTYQAHEHGIQKMIARGGKLRGNEARITLDLPKRREGSTVMTVQVAPSLAVTMLDALPYLIDYPYGCTEQTMSRFLPAAITARTLRGLGIEPADVMHKAFGGIEQAHAAKTHAKGKRSIEKLDEMIRQGLARLYDFQHSDGGWGWWKHGESDRFMTAYVVWGLILASQADIEVRTNAIERGASFLNVNLVQEERALDRQAWMLHALSVHHSSAQKRQAHEYQAKAFSNLWNNREQLNAYSRALLTLAAANYGYRDKAKILVDNLANGAIRDEAPDTSVIMRGEPRAGSKTIMGTARWGKARGWWRWSQGGIETTAFVLRALMAVDPHHELIEPAMNWLVKNRRGAQWSNTRDTAIVVLALNDYLKISKELGEPSQYAVLVNGEEIAQKKLSGKDLIAAPSTFTVNPKLIQDGENTITIRKDKGRALYFFARADFFSLEEPIQPAANEIFLRRQYYKWTGRPSLLKGTVYERRPVGDGDTIVSGERVEVVVTVESKNDYEYLVLEDLKPAGLEAVQVKSGQPAYIREIKASTVDESFKTKKPKGWKKRLSSASFEHIDYTGRSRQVHQELRDRKVALFVDKLPQGVWEIRYDLRAEVPGKFHALPLLGHAMYVPEIRANGAEVRLEVFDR